MQAPLLTAAEVAEILRVSVETVYKYAQDGALDHIRIGGTLRFRRSDVENLVGAAVPEPEASA